MFLNTWNFIKDWFKEKNDRSKLVSDFNNAAKAAFITGVAPTLLKSKISRGDSSYKHQFSNFWYSGFRIKALSGRQLSKDEMQIIGLVVLNDETLVRRLIVLGFDTLEVHGDEGNYGLKWQLRNHLLIG